MKKQILFGAGALVLVAVPAMIGLWGNASFAQSVPVRVPASGQIATPAPTPSPSSSVDDHGGDTPRDDRTEPGDDRDANGGGTQSPAPAPSQGGADDHGGDTPRDQRTEPGDDRRSGSDDSSGRGSDDSGRGSDDSSGRGSGGDDSGHGGDD
ncbi:hypothetical protein [Microbacterium sp.]|uniref:hypothetical protein n=1 Tax=Microbacterium sp. TaxID=51671 RepID=UPI003F6EADC8